MKCVICHLFGCAQSEAEYILGGMSVCCDHIQAAVRAMPSTVGIQTALEWLNKEANEH
jgi:hypothetical protein